MRGRAQPLDIGPFTGGLNLSGNPYSIADNELVELHNLNVESDGSLYTRPPIYEVTPPPGNGKDFRVLLRVNLGNNVDYLMVSTTVGIYMYNVDTGTYTMLRINGLNPGINPWLAAVLINGWIYVSGLDSGRIQANVNWNWVPDSNIPLTHCFVTHKSRIFALDTTKDSRVEYSNLITADASYATWNATNNWFDVSRGDGSALTYMMVFNNDLILFKENKTFTFIYDLDIQTEGTLRMLSPVIGGGVNGHARVTYGLNLSIRPAVAYQNSIFVMHETKLYEMVGYNFVEVNTKIPFPSVPLALESFDDYILVTFLSRIYAYHVPLKTWSIWETLRPYNHLTPALRSDGRMVYYGGSLTAGRETFYAMSTDEMFATTLAGEVFTIYFRTKSYDFGDTFHYKKLMWWLLSYTSPNPSQQTSIVARAVAEDPYGASTEIWDSVTPAISPIQTVARFLRTLRFKRIYFSVSQVSQIGASITGGGRTRFFGLGAAVAQKQTLNQKGN